MVFSVDSVSPWLACDLEQGDGFEVVCLGEQVDEDQSFDFVGGGEKPDVAGKGCSVAGDVGDFFEK